MNVFEFLRQSPLLRQPPLAIAVNVAVYVCFLLIAVAVIADFRAYHRQARGVRLSDRSWVETGSMTAFLVAYYLVVRLRVGEVPVSGAWRGVMIGAGLLLMVIGAVVNVAGRLHLKSNWANQIKIYDGHFLVTTGPYALVRHPLYASLIWMFVGGSLVYSNAAALVLALAVFVPMMRLRAAKEEALLAEAFGEAHETYRRSTGMLFPRIPR